MIFVAEAAARPADIGDVERAQGGDDVAADAADMGDRRIAADPDAAVNAGAEMLGNLLGRLLVEIGDLRTVIVVILVDLRRHRIEQRQLDHVRPEARLGDGSRVAVVAALGEVCHDVGLGQRARRLQRQQLRIAGTGTDADKTALWKRVHRPGLANELSAAAVIALPPSLPRTMA